MDKRAYMCLDREGNELPEGKGRCAIYRVDKVDASTFVLTKRGLRCWKSLMVGTLAEVDNYLHENVSAVSEKQPIVGTVAHVSRVATTVDTTKQVPKRVIVGGSAVVNEVVSRLGCTKMRESDVYAYLLRVLWRNKQSSQLRVINTRLVDSMEQPIYLLYTGDFNKNASLGYARVVDTIEHAKYLCATVSQDKLPDPIQWCDNVEDYFWNPMLKPAPLSQKAVEHVLSDREDRIPRSISELSKSALIRALKDSIRDGCQKAMRDVCYALPCYFKSFNRVLMLLPFRICTGDSEVPEAVLALIKEKHSYRLVTILTPEQAYQSVIGIRDPETTWLRGVYGKQRI